MSTSTLPLEKYPGLEEGFPADCLPFFFKGQELNFVGQMAVEILAARKARKLLATSTLTFDLEAKKVFLTVQPIHVFDIPSDIPKGATTNWLNQLAAEYMQNELGIKGFRDSYAP